MRNIQDSDRMMALAAARDPGSWYLWFKWGEYAMNEQQPTNASTHFSRAVNILGQSPLDKKHDIHVIASLYFRYAEVLKMTGDAANAKKYVMKALEELPDKREYEDFLKSLQ
jgi:tetratricopeptide (TPR) repeat protein